MSSILYLLVRCSLDPTRAEIFEQVADNLLSQNNFESINESLVVFDNGSTQPSKLLPKFKHVVQSNANVGYWTALRWLARYHPALLNSTRRYVYSIESDCLHERIERLAECEEVLSAVPTISMVRTQEFSIAERDLYDKHKPSEKSREYAWQSQFNRFRNNERVYFRHLNGQIYGSNFTPVVCGLNRLDPFSLVLEAMAAKANISEADFQGCLDILYPETAIYDGGLFHSKLSFASGAVAGSRTETHVAGYRSTQHDKIEPDGTFQIVRLS